MQDKFTMFFIALGAALPLHAALGQSDIQLTKLMAGAWRSPRHDYIYYADGTWSMDKPEPYTAHGRWRVRHRHLEESITYGDDKGSEPTEDHGLIRKLTRHEVLFVLSGDVYSMTRIKMEEVDAPR